MEQVISAISAIPTIFETIKGYMGLNISMKDLETQIKQLSNQQTDMETEVIKLEREGKRKRKREADGWIEQAKELINEFQTLKEGTIHAPLWKKLKCVDDVKKMKETVKELRDEGRNIGEPTVDVDERRVPSIVVPLLSGKTSNDNLEKLYGWLEDDKVLSIGVYGMGGVGKTTLVKHIHNRILQKMPHVKVYWVTVSQDSSIRKLQDDIAKIAGLEFLDENEEKRAAILHQHLVGKKTVVILDDVWKCIHLEKLGNLHRVEGCKFIITSRSLEVCRKIECQELFKVKTLDDNEAWNLFKENLLLHGHTVLTDTIEKLAKSLAKKCGGIPLALNTVAASMRGVNDDHRWRNAIKNFQNASLQMEDLENNVFEILKFSYNRLNDERLKKCFLYCCLYPEDHKIDKYELIMKFIAEGLCEDTDQGHSILNKLADIFLLEGGEGYVKMHDLIREMALRISKFMVKSEIPEEGDWIPELERVSFIKCNIKEIPDDFSPRCHNLSTLILQSYRQQLIRISESFLLYMTQLRVLDLSYNYWIECLPNSISNLENLCGLFLEGCVNISFLPPLKKLRSLRVLNIEGSGITDLHQDMECLVSLQYLNMMNTYKLKEIPRGIISKLRNLRCLQLWHIPSFQSEELNCLPHLEEFTNWYDELHSFNRSVKKLEQLEGYDIFVGENYTRRDGRGKNKIVYFEAISFKGERGQEIEVLLPANICRLRIDNCEGLNGCVVDFFQSMSNLRELNHFGVFHCNEVQWIFNSEQITENAGGTPFKSLMKLGLYGLPNLISMCKGEDVILPDCTFSFLKYLFINKCDSIKKLLPQALLQNLKNLERLFVVDCCQLEVVIGVGDEEGSSNSPLLSSSNIYLPKLKQLQLHRLPKLKSICNGREMICPSIQNIQIWRCENVKRMPSFLPINEASGQPHLPSSFQVIELLDTEAEKEWWESLEWHNPNAKGILQSHIKWVRPAVLPY